MAQRDFARCGLVADGRDMGSVVSERALRFFAAKPEIRAKRRFKQLIEKEFLVH